MENSTQRDFGLQPIQKIIEENHLNPHDLVAASTEQITHKMIAKAVKGRRLTRHVQVKILNAVNKVLGKNYVLSDLFNYEG